MAKERNKRKIYKYKYKPRKKRKNSLMLKKFFSVLSFILLLCLLVVLGYTIAGPLMKVIHADNTDTTAEISTSSGEIQVITNVENDLTPNDSVDNTEGQKKNISNENISAVRIPSDSLKSVEQLKKAVGDVKSSDKNDIIKNILVPLKLRGGELNYFSLNKDAVAAGAVVSDLTLKDIFSIVDSYGYTPVAEMSLLEDSIYSKYNTGSAFVTKSGSRWIDDSADAGGKSWLDPSKEKCRTYLKSVTAEITSAGFKTIICKDLKYPNFRQSDIGYLGSEFSDAARYRNLTDLANDIENTAKQKNAAVYVCEDIVNYIDGKSEIVKKESLKTKGLIFDIDLDTIKSSELKTSMGEELKLDGMSDEKAVAAVVSAAGLSELAKFDIGFEYKGSSIDNDELQTISEDVYVMGYTSYILNNEME